MDDLVLEKRDGAPGIAAGGLCGTQGAGDALEVWVDRCHFAQHLFVAGDGQFGEVVGDAFNVDAEHGGEVFFIAKQKIDLADQLAIHFLCLGFAADGFPK